MIHIRNTVILGIVVALIIGFAGGFAVARAKYKPLLEKQSGDIITRDNELKILREAASKQTTESKNDVLYGIQNGKLVVNDNGNITFAVTDVSLSNKTKVGKDGTVTRSDGSKFKLESGEWYSVNTSTSSAK